MCFLQKIEIEHEAKSEMSSSVAHILTLEKNLSKDNLVMCTLSYHVSPYADAGDPCTSNDDDDDVDDDDNVCTIVMRQ